MINTMCSKRSNYTIIESLIFRFLFFDHTNNFSNTHISRPLLYISDYFFSLSFCRYVMLLLHVKSKSLIIFHQKRFDSWSVFGHDIKNIHEQQTDEVWDGMIQTRSCYSIFFLEIWKECPYFFLLTDDHIYLNVLIKLNLIAINIILIIWMRKVKYVST